MIKPSEKDDQGSFLLPNLESLLDQRQALCKLSRAIDWKRFEREMGASYSEGQGAPGKPIRLMVGLLMLKQLHDLSDDDVVAQWVQNPYFQYFTGEIEFQWRLPIDPSSLSRFRRRVGEEGFEAILAESIRLHGRKARERTVIVDTTVQEKDVTFPTDSKLHRKIAEKCVKMAKEEGVGLRRSYRRTLPKLMKDQHNRSHPKRAKSARASARRLKTIAGGLVRELRRNLPADALEELGEDLDLFDKVLAQKRSDKNKVYSLHEPEVSCIGKGKAHKKWEFGQKASIARTYRGGIIVGAKSFRGNVSDQQTLEPAFAQIERVAGVRPKDCLADRGYRGRKIVGETRIHIPGRPKKDATAYQKSRDRKRFRKRAGIEPVIGHLKSDFRLGRNFLKGLLGDSLNLLMAAAAFNLKKWINQSIFCAIIRALAMRQTNRSSVA
jgi:IS5 family transposase